MSEAGPYKCEVSLFRGFYNVWKATRGRSAQRKKLKKKSKGRDSRVPARGPDQGLQTSSEFLPLHPNPLLSLREIDKDLNFTLF